MRDHRRTPAQHLAAFVERTTREHETFLGFPAALDFDYRELEPLWRLMLNNIGDPYAHTWHGANSREFEREVVGFFAELFRAPADNHWGYVTNGSTESNLYALYLARTLHPDAPVYYSHAAHYSVPKNIHLLGMRGVPVRAQPSGEMNYGDLSQRLRGQAGCSAIVVATVGTTMTEARDDVARIRRTLRESGVSESFIHADAALAGIYAALLEPHHPFDFSDGADSLCISGHKFIGSPIPCGVVLVRRDDRECLGGELNYTGSPDTTISGSRNGHTPILLWHAIQRWGIEGFRRRAEQALGTAEYTLERLRAIGWEAWRNPGALTVMLVSPPRELMYKWQLATAGGWSHLVCVPGVTTQKIDAFIAELEQV